ncbi:MAG: hypothetical protein ACW990_19575 [Promethearchaeota archaeon]|jgi:hypothetical protein
MENNASETETESKQSFFWDSEKKRPRKFVVIIIILIPLLILIGHYINIFILHHEIRVITEYDGGFDCTIIIEGEVRGGGGSNREEFVFRIREGVRIDVQVKRAGGGIGQLTVSIYDNGNLAANETTTEQHQPINLVYIVGEKG